MSHMKRKQQFLEAVQLLAPDDALIISIARRIAEESLPQFPGGAALEFVTAIQSLKPSHISCRQGKRSRRPHTLGFSHAIQHSFTA
jgi:hypothetical protein